MKNKITQFLLLAIAFSMWGMTFSHFASIRRVEAQGTQYYGPTQNVAAGTAVMTTVAITAPACGTTVTVAAPNVVASDVIVVSFNAAPAGTNAGLVSWPTAGNVNFAYCPGVTETPAAATINWKVAR